MSCKTDLQSSFEEAQAGQVVGWAREAGGGESTGGRGRAGASIKGAQIPAAAS